MGASGDDIGALERDCQWDDSNPWADGVAVNAAHAIRTAKMAAAAMLFVPTVVEIASAAPASTPPFGRSRDCGWAVKSLPHYAAGID
jgi:hypothetical protein